jgi:hypothetical protein
MLACDLPLEPLYQPDFSFTHSAYAGLELLTFLPQPPGTRGQACAMCLGVIHF